MSKGKGSTPIVKCGSCGTEMRHLGSQSVRMGEEEIYPGGLFSPSVPVGVAVPFEVYLCPWCNKVEFYAKAETRDIIQGTIGSESVSRKDVRLCKGCNNYIPKSLVKCKYCGAPRLGEK